MYVFILGIFPPPVPESYKNQWDICINQVQKYTSDKPRFYFIHIKNPYKYATVKTENVY